MLNLKQDIANVIRKMMFADGDQANGHAKRGQKDLQVSDLVKLRFCPHLVNKQVQQIDKVTTLALT